MNTSVGVKQLMLSFDNIPTSENKWLQNMFCWLFDFGVAEFVRNGKY